MALKTSLSSGNRRTQTKAAAMLLHSLFPQPAHAASLQTPAIPYIHIVKPGETLAGIAALYGVSVQDLRTANNLDNRATVVRCHPNADSTQVRGTVRVKNQPAGGYRVAFSWQPDADGVARRVSGEDSAPGGYVHVLDGGGPRAGNWWFWVENSAGSRISEMAHLNTDGLPHAGICQRAVIDFDIRNPALTYVGRRLGTAAGGAVTNAWTAAFYPNRELSGEPAHAEIDRPLATGPWPLPWFPRTRGDRPCLCHFAALPSRLSSRPSETPDFQLSTEHRQRQPQK